ncbi:nuclear transport factor 2 family protein [Niastella caeni]|uniref:Nuclear transport factor 2 family protein n=1 Tax=Niastella caeni TaxID=2569763 RepID=A0A4S8HN96_9BACT|nr:nuclear transport factor 2 family protein [Niastella caeni]THU35929.1 nuclear transport factor 2 family protein [Niastella caeni]
MRKILLGTICIMLLAACKNESEKDSKTAIAAESTQTRPPVEFADQKYIDMGKKALEQFESGDIDTWASRFADNAIFRWSSGDSLAGKEAIAKYWKERRMNVIDSLRFSNEIWLPVSVNQPQGPEAKGVWLLNWYQVNVTFKNKQKLQFWTHIDIHYNNENLVDEMIQYIDRAPINAAIGKK